MIFRDRLLEINSEMILWDNMDDAVIGYNPTTLKAVYDIDKLIECCIRNYEMDIDEAIEWVEYNIISTHVGTYTPEHIYVYEK
jgi:hypothetical protein